MFRKVLRSRFARAGLGGAGLTLAAVFGLGARESYCEDIDSLRVKLTKAQIKGILDSYAFSRTCGNGLAAVVLGGLVVSMKYFTKSIYKHSHPNTAHI